MGLQQRSHPLCTTDCPAASTDSFEDPASAGPSASQHAASLPLPAPTVSWHCSAQPPRGSSNPHKSLWPRSARVIFPTLQTSGRGTSASPGPRRSPGLASSSSFYPGLMILPLKCFFFFFESSTCPGYTHPFTKLPKCCSQTVSHRTVPGFGILLLGPHCLESAPHRRAQPPGPSCHPAD